MDTFDQTLDFTLERARATKAIMATLASPPYNYMWDGPSPGNVGNQIEAVDLQEATLAGAKAATTETAALWDNDLGTLVADAMLGTRLARVKFEQSPIPLRQFDHLGYRSAGRDGRYQQALLFEKAWNKAAPAWNYKPGLTLPLFKTRREAIKTREDECVVAQANERHERVVLHSLAAELNGLSVKWYGVATATHPEDTIPGQLIRTIPTTYDPNRAPGQLRFTAHLSAAPNQAHLLWRAPRGERYYISAKGPSATSFALVLDGITDTEWMGLGLMPGPWSFQGYATNQHGTGTPSAVLELIIAAAAVAA